jgi:pimeloyl-ACP methyl ester carboxylesterase
MPYADNQGVRIRYEVDGNGPPLVLLHGLTSYLESWHEAGYVNSLRSGFKLILIDMRGHGGSDKPHDPESYRLELLAGDVVAVMDDLKVGEAHFMGYSLGGRMAFALAKYSPERFRSFIIGGANPDEILSQESGRLREWLQALEKGMDTVIAAFEKAGLKVTPEMKARLLANDTEALSAFVLASEWRASLEYALPNMTVPCLFLVCEADPNCAGARKCANRMRNAEFVSFPGIGHFDFFEARQSHSLLPHITKFLEKVGHA